MARIDLTIAKTYFDQYDGGNPNKEEMEMMVHSTLAVGWCAPESFVNLWGEVIDPEDRRPTGRMC